MHEAKLAKLAELSVGWDRLDSQPMSLRAKANYVAWSDSVPADRIADAEPMLTDAGHIRLEWLRDDHAYIAEIGPDSLYMVDLAPRAEDDADAELTFDAAALTRFFITGSLT